MTERLTFSPEQPIFAGRPTNSLGALYESFAYQDDVYEYFLTAREEYTGEPAFSDLVGFKDDLDDFYGTRAKIGETFLDGGVVALDAVALVAPNLLDLLHEQMVITRNSLTIDFRTADPTHEDERSYAQAIRYGNMPLQIQYAPEFSRIMGSVARLRSLKGDQQQLPLMQGFAFMMGAAHRAAKADMAAFRSDVFDEIALIEYSDVVSEPVRLVSEVNRALKRARERGASSSNDA